MFNASASDDPLASSIGWITGTMLGDLAVTLCVLAVAFVGFSMLTGRVSLRRGGQVILGCFLLLGAPVIAANLLALADGGGGQPEARPTVVYEAQPREPLQPADDTAARPTP